MHTRTEFVIGNNKLCLMMLRANLVPRVLSPLPPPPPPPDLQKPPSTPARVTKIMQDLT